MRDLRRRASGRETKRNSARLEKDTTSSVGKHDDAVVGSKRPPNRISEGLRNLLSLSKVKFSGTLPSSDTVLCDNVHSLQRHPTLPSHSRCSSISGEDLYGALSNIPPSQFASHSTLPPLSPLSLNLLAVQSDTQVSTLSRNSSMRKFRERVKGTRPAFCFGRVYLDERDGGMGEPRGTVSDEFGFLTTGDENLEGKLSRRSSWGKGRGINERLVAIKITPRSVPGSTMEEEERTRVRFVREVEVLRVSNIFVLDCTIGLVSVSSRSYRLEAQNTPSSFSIK